MGMWSGNDADACDKLPWKMTPSGEAASGESQRASLHTSEAACSIAESPDSEDPPTLQSMFHPTPEMRDELVSLEESWKAFLETWTSLLIDRSLDDNHAWPTLQQVLDKMMEQVATPDYSDKHSEFSHDSGVALTGYSPAFSQPEDQSNSDDDVLNSAMPHYFSDCTSSTSQAYQYITADNKSLGVCYVSRPLKNTKSPLVCDVDKILSKTCGESPVNPFGILEDNTAEAASPDVERQEMRAKSSYNEETVRCILPLDTFQTYSDHSSSDLTEVQSMTLQPSRENAGLAGYQATLMNEFSEDNSPYDVMEWPSCAQATAVDNVYESSWEGAFDDEEALKPEYSSHGGRPYANFYESGSEPITPATWTSAFEEFETATS
ncbi:hypothetical protein HPB50_016623 [Hyalomma asiaticum]|uniref:Uncharacterized protein n=1 Tax=Hyalomma asiaticum TaxID=266040 RepID=A0ACB7RN55_HYAAI|nr:hypothetical protein HPB50_016623 [Hyalomma asiaticum]